jgi:hypothetical protein
LVRKDSIIIGTLVLNILSDEKYMADANKFLLRRDVGDIVSKMPQNGYSGKKASLLDQRILIGIIKAIVLK